MTQKRIDAFLECLRQQPNTARACRITGIGRTTINNMKQADPEFAKQWDEAIDIGVGKLEEEMHRRAVDGVPKGVWHNGKKVGEEHQYSDTLAIFLAKAARPEVYRERYDHNISGKDGGPVEFVVNLSGETDDDE